MIGYVVGLVFDLSRNRVVLIKKEHGPRCVVGKWNGVGGKVERGETTYQAMSREFMEEAGRMIRPKNWNNFCNMKSEEFYIEFF